MPLACGVADGRDCGGGGNGASGRVLLAGVDSARSRDWSRSSCAGGGVACGVTLPNIPVALVESLAEDSPGPEKFELSNGDFDESMLCTPRLQIWVVVLESKLTSQNLDSKAPTPYDSHTNWPQEIQAAETKSAMHSLCCGVSFFTAIIVVRPPLTTFRRFALWFDIYEILVACGLVRGNVSGATPFSDPEPVF